MVVNIVERLKSLGFSEYESRLYIALLQENPVTAYEAAKNAGIPSAKVYGVVDKLQDKGLVLELLENNKKRYVPQDPDIFLESYRRKMEEHVDHLSDELKKQTVKSNVSYLWNIRTREDLLIKARDMIRQCRKSLLCSLWEDELVFLRPDLENAQSRGVKVAVVHFGESDNPVGQMFNHPIADTLYQEKGGRGVVLIGDGQQALMATIQSQDTVDGGWSGSKGFVTLAEDYVKHDIYIMKIVNRFEKQLKDTFGPNYEKLRDIYHDKENTDGYD